jgi:hypothetical protein
MKPSTPHYVLTLENSITYGQHFYAAAQIRQTIWTIIHVAMSGNSLTNASHPNAIFFLQRILFYSIHRHWCRESDNSEDGYKKYSKRTNLSFTHILIFAAHEHHILDPSTSEGLLDMTYLGNLISLVDALGIAPKSKVYQEQRTYVQHAFWEFRKLYSTTRWLVFDDVKKEPLAALFDPSLLQMAVTMVHHYRKMKKVGGTCNKRTLEYLDDLFQKHFAHLEKDFKAQCRDRAPDYVKSYKWTGGTFTIAAKPPNNGAAVGK